jgi:hypothetical protein
LFQFLMKIFYSFKADAHQQGNLLNKRSLPRTNSSPNKNPWKNINQQSEGDKTRKTLTTNSSWMDLYQTELENKSIRKQANDTVWNECWRSSVVSFKWKWFNYTTFTFIKSREIQFPVDPNAKINSTNFPPFFLFVAKLIYFFPSVFEI